VVPEPPDGEAALENRTAGCVLIWLRGAGHLPLIGIAQISRLQRDDLIDDIGRMFLLEIGGVLMRNTITDDGANVTAIIGPERSARHSRASSV
jgi:hypothetical protein